LPLRSVSAPNRAMMSLMACCTAGSSAASAGTIPSPLKRVSAKILAVSATSARLMASAAPLPRLLRMRLALASIALPSGVAVVMEASMTVSEPASRGSSEVRRAESQAMAASNSGTRMRPSLSESSSASVVASKRTPRVGQLRAVHSF